MKWLLIDPYLTPDSAGIAVIHRIMQMQGVLNLSKLVDLYENHEKCGC